MATFERLKPIEKQEEEEEEEEVQGFILAFLSKVNLIK